MNFERIKAQQDLILKRIYSSFVEPEKSPATGILNKISTVKLNEIDLIFGHIGHKIKSFVEIIDLDHPDIDNFLEGHLAGEKKGTFSKISLDLIDIFNFCKGKDISFSITECLQNKIYESDIFSKLENCIDSSLDNQLHVRFVKNIDHREKIRSTKKFQNIKLNTVLAGGKDTWDNYPDGLFNYSRYNNMFSKNLFDAKARTKAFIDHGLIFMAEEAEKKIKEINYQERSSKYFGFNRISVIYAAIILAKMCGFNVDEKDMESSLFLDKEKKIFLSSKIYNFSEISNQCSDKIIGLVKHLECFPQLNYKPLFDHYRVVLPCLDFPRSDEKLPVSLQDKTGRFLEFFDLDEAQKQYNMNLVRDENLLGVLLGERDGEHFFISYFF